MNVVPTAVIREIAAAEVVICACGCGGLVEFKKHHLRTPARFIHGHGRALAPRKWLEENQGKHVCACGCGEAIELRVNHRSSVVGIPKFKPGHHLPRVNHRHQLGNQRLHHARRAGGDRCDFSFADRVRILQRDGFSCRACSDSRLEQLEFDHVVALCLGGTHAIENGQALCHNCHAKKSVADRRAYRIAAWQAGNAQSPTEVS